MLKIVFTVLLLGGLSLAQTPFRLSITEPPKQLDPHRARSSSGQYLSQQLYRNFYRFDEKNNYVSELGETCLKYSSRWVCILKKNLKWSDGSPLVAEDFVKSFQRILTLPSPRADLLFGILNAQAVHDKKMSAEKLGIKALSPTRLEINFEKGYAPQEFILMSPLLVPLPQGEHKEGVASGPYKIKTLTPTKILLEPNSFYFKKTNRPPVELLLYEENLALEAFNKKEIDLLRRVPTALIPTYKDKPDFLWVDVVRLDAIIMGPALFEKPELRKILAESLNYDSMQKLYNSPYRPGCMGLPPSFYQGQEICYQGNQKFENGDSQIKLHYTYSTQGGDDHRRLAEWLQNQWKVNGKIDVSVQGLENKIFLEKIETHPSELYRKGLSPENPTCYGAVEVFHSKHPDNFLQLTDPKFDNLVLKLSKNPTDKKLCRTALEYLLKAYRMIPTGRISFAYRINPEWKNVRINALNHLDLSELSKKKP